MNAPDQDFETLLRNIEAAPDLDAEASRNRILAETLFSMLTSQQKTAFLAEPEIAFMAEIAALWGEGNYAEAGEREDARNELARPQDDGTARA